MSAAPVPVTYPCGCCPDMGVYCDEIRPLVWAKRKWEAQGEIADLLRDEPDEQLRNEGLASTAENAIRTHLAGRW